MMIAGEYTFPLRSLAPARSLLPHSLRGAWICAIFISSFFRYPIRGGGGDDGVAVLRFAPRPVLRLVFSFRLYVRCSLFIHTVASRKRRRFSSITAPRLSRAPVPSNPPPCRPLPHSLRLFRLGPRPVLRLVSRSVLIPSRLARCVERLAAHLAVAPFCSARFFVLPMPCRHHRLTTG